MKKEKKKTGEETVAQSDIKREQELKMKKKKKWNGIKRKQDNSRNRV